MKHLIEVIGSPAMLEQTAEEATELAFACLKLARLLRNENEIYGRTVEELINSIEEEFADILVCKSELTSYNVINDGKIDSWIFDKKTRMQKRLKEDKE